MTERQVSFLYLGAAICWAATIYYLSSLPGPDVPRFVTGYDKLLHAGVFGILGILMTGAVTAAQRGCRTWPFWFVVTVVALYGTLDELHQSFVPGRSADILDVLADSTGGLLGAWFMVLAMNVIRRNAKQTAGRI